MADVVVGASAVEVLYLSKNTSALTPTGQSVTTGNTAVLTPDATAVDGNGVGTAAAKPFKGRYMLVRMVPGAASTVTFKAGVTGQTPANLASTGDLVLSSFSADTVIQLELARFLQANGTVRADVGGTGPVVFSVVNLTKSA